jgi:hypothetical protein
MSLDDTDHVYDGHHPLVMTLTVVNDSGRPCTAYVKKGTSRSATFTVLHTSDTEPSYSEEAWSSTFCQHDAPPLSHDVAQVWAVGHREVQTFSWSEMEFRMYEMPSGKAVCMDDPPNDRETYAALAAWPSAHPYAMSNRVLFHIHWPPSPEPTTTSTWSTSTSTTTSTTSTTV